VLIDCYSSRKDLPNPLRADKVEKEMSPKFSNHNTKSDAERTEEEWRKVLVPSVSLEAVEELLQRHFTAQTYRVLQQLDSYDDANYKVQLDDKLYLFKIHNGVESKQFLQKAEISCIAFQNALMEALRPVPHITSNLPVERTKESFENSNNTTPTVVSASLSVVSEQHSPQTLCCRLLSWVPGRPMSTILFLPVETLLRTGAYLGHLHRAFDVAFPQQNAEKDAPWRKAAQRYHIWNLRHVLDIRPFVIRYLPQANDKQARILSILDAFAAQLPDFQQTLPVGVCHNDLNDANILCDEQCRVTGVIDYGDAVETWRVADVAVCMAYAMLSSYGKSQRGFSAAAAVLRGYHSVTQLSEAERRAIPLLIACRLATSVTLGFYSYQQNPENTYLLLHAQPAWNALALLWPLDENKRTTLHPAIHRLLEQAVSQSWCEESEVVGDICVPDPTVEDPFVNVRLSS
jgi:Ser/Thr protein kinase RdoA (MazF antagonist)